MRAVIVAVRAPEQVRFPGVVFHYVDHVPRCETAAPSGRRFEMFAALAERRFELTARPWRFVVSRWAQLSKVSFAAAICPATNAAEANKSPSNPLTSIEFSRMLGTEPA